uniref:Uncharacterized protein n=1 Tax=Pseudonaja textilis TaxID=8673 RepID=A0A670ZTV7_PSETE
MDLFGDLPEPTPPAVAKEGQKGSLLFDDLPPISNSDLGMIVLRSPFFCFILSLCVIEHYLTLNLFLKGNTFIWR